MKVHRLSQSAVRSAEPRQGITELSEKDLQRVAGAGCMWEIDHGDGYVVIGHHPAYPRAV